MPDDEVALTVGRSVGVDVAWTAVDIWQSVVIKVLLAVGGIFMDDLLYDYATREAHYNVLNAINARE